jgi:YidC/Oxa1 family membrane protein insertase
MSGSIFDPLYKGVAQAVVRIHNAIWEPIFGRESGWGWALSIVVLTMLVRLALFPLFKKQIRSQRKLQELQPKFRELREKYKNDRQKLNEEMMKIQKEHGNPLLGGCGPIFLQAPLFLALFRVMNGFKPRQQNYVTAEGVHCATEAAKAVANCYKYVPIHSLSRDTVETIATSKVFGVPLASAFNSPTAVLEKLTADSGTVKLIAGLMIVIMSATTFITQKQIMGRQPLPEDPQQRQQQQMTQKVFLYLAPGMLMVSGLLFPIGVLTYWLTTNVWSMAQQRYIFASMPPTFPPGTVAPQGPPPKRPAPGAPVSLTKGPGAAEGGRSGLRGRRPGKPTSGAVPPPVQPEAPKLQQVKPVKNRPNNGRPGGNQSNKKRKKRR